MPILGEQMGNWSTGYIAGTCWQGISGRFGSNPAATGGAGMLPSEGQSQLVRYARVQTKPYLAVKRVKLTAILWEAQS